MPDSIVINYVAYVERFKSDSFDFAYSRADHWDLKRSQREREREQEVMRGSDTGGMEVICE